MVVGRAHPFADAVTGWGAGTSTVMLDEMVPLTVGVNIVAGCLAAVFGLVMIECLAMIEIAPPGRLPAGREDALLGKAGCDVAEGLAWPVDPRTDIDDGARPRVHQGRADRSCGPDQHQPGLRGDRPVTVQMRGQLVKTGPGRRGQGDRQMRAPALPSLPPSDGPTGRSVPRIALWSQARRQAVPATDAAGRVRNERLGREHSADGAIIGWRDVVVCHDVVECHDVDRCRVVGLTCVTL